MARDKPASTKHQGKKATSPNSQTRGTRRKTCTPQPNTQHSHHHRLTKCPPSPQPNIQNLNHHNPTLNIHTTTTHHTTFTLSQTNEITTQHTTSTPPQPNIYITAQPNTQHPHHHRLTKCPPSPQPNIQHAHHHNLTFTSQHNPTHNIHTTTT
ncbi:mucin-2-like [Penaeus indicus]|uniref:mucin-2-like n=1 Tax=Penaeus indicus TaxID=29960 RepID=UPI00300D230B